MTVQFAYYGLSCVQYELEYLDQYVSTNWVRKLCNGRTSCSGTVSTTVLMDPYHGCAKDFLAIAECPNGDVITDFLSKEAEGTTFSLHC